VAEFQDPPTFAEVVILPEQLRLQGISFNPIWLKWFLDLAAVISASGGGSGSFVHNDMSSIQGGSVTERFHLDADTYAALTASSGQLKLGNGTAGAPSYSFSSDLTNGLFLSAADTLGLSTGGVESIRVTAGHHLSHKGTSPTIFGGGGTGATIAGKDEAFVVTVGTGGVALSVTVTFAAAFTNAPVCSACSDTDIVPFIIVATTTTVQITSAAPWTVGSKINVICRSWE